MRQNEKKLSVKDTDDDEQTNFYNDGSGASIFHGGFSIQG